MRIKAPCNCLYFVIISCISSCNAIDIVYMICYGCEIGALNHLLYVTIDADYNYRL